MDDNVHHRHARSVAMNAGLLLVSVNPATLDEHQLHLLEREVDQVLDLRE